MTRYRDEHASIDGVALKKKYGQHFLRDRAVIDAMIARVSLDAQTSVMEIGCGDGFLTRAILEQPVARLWSFEIDPDWATHVRTELADPRLSIFEEDILQVDFGRFEPHQPWVVLANLPYQITFPILYRFEKWSSFFREGVVMVQEEVAQKVVASGGRGFGFVSLYLQHAFEWQLLDKIPPSAFVPPPKVFSRLLHFVSRKTRQAIPDEEGFWKFVRCCFSQPRRTLKNNLLSGGFAIERLSSEILSLRGQQICMDQLLEIWSKVR